MAKKRRDWVHLDDCKRQFERFFNDEQSGVFILKGPYGSGKSYFVRHTILADTEFRKHFRFSSQVSLFGLRSLIGLEEAVVGSLKLGEKGLKTDAVDKGFSAIQKALSPLAGGVDLQLSAKGIFWAMASNLRFLLVIDDVDRKSPDLNLDEVLGFASSLSEQSEGKTKVVLVVNEDGITDSGEREKLNQLREKFIDFEFQFNPPARELADCYIKSDVLSSVIGDIFESVGSPNIRAMKKIESHVKNFSKFLADKGIEIDDSQRWQAAKFSFLFLNAGKSYRLGDLASGDLEEIRRYYVTASGRRDEALEERRSNLNSLMQDIEFAPDAEWDSILFEFLKTGTVSSERLDEFKRSIPRKEEADRYRLYERRVHSLLHGSYRDTSRDLISEIDRGVREFPNRHSVESIQRYSRIFEEFGADTDGLWKTWIDARKDQFSTATIATLQDIVPKSVRKYLPRVDLSCVVPKDPIDLLLFYKDRGHSIDRDVYLRELSKWSEAQWVNWLTNLSEVDEERLDGLPGLLRELLQDKVHGGDRSKVAGSVERALRSLASQSMLNRWRIEHQFPGLLADRD